MLRSAHPLLGVILLGAVRSSAAMVKAPSPLLTRSAYPHFEQIQTRVTDNDEQGHINNAKYYCFFDDAINAHLTRHGFSFAIRRVTSESSCRYLRQLSYPVALDVGLRCQLGRSSAAYELGVFAEGADEASAVGTFTHVYVNNDDRPCRIDSGVRALLEKLVPRE
jgi:acyl-CoA thioester hydrolase